MTTISKNQKKGNMIAMIIGFTLIVVMILIFIMIR